MSTGSNSTNQYPVYVGTWTNWSRGQILGATLTLGRREVDLLIAFTALFVAFVATRVWRIICFAIHQSCSKETPQNAIYHQHQAILRNSSTPEDGIRLLVYIIRVGKNSKGRFRPLSTVTVATFCILSFTIAGGFSSYISTAIGDEVLLKSMNCGQSAVGGGPFYIQNFFTGAYVSEQLNNAANYAQQCYSSASGGLLNCGRFVKQQIIGNIDENAGCPFRNDLCRNDFSNIRIDSGYLSSHDHFGLNSPPNERILWRNVYHCAPLVTTGHTSQSNTSFGDATLYHYGNSTSFGNYIYAAKSLENQYSFVLSNSSALSYSNFDIQSIFAAVKEGKVQNESNFFPNDSIFREDADINIHFLSGNGVLFAKPSNDTWYQVAATPVNQLVANANQSVYTSIYLPSEPSSPLACTDQYQFCNSVSGNRKCGPLSNLRDAVAGVVDLFNTTYSDFAVNNVTTRTATLFTYFTNAISDISVPEIITHLGPASLHSQRYLSGGFQYLLETNQWKLDAANWWNISMAARQAAFLGYAYGPTDPAILAQRINYTTPEFKKVCDNQKMRTTTGYGSFSLFGVVFIFLVGGSLVTTSYLLEPISTCLYEKRGYKKYEHLEWTSHATLQLQRLAQEKAGFGTWSDCTDTVPITKANELLGPLDITDPNHPILQPSSPEKRVLNNPQSSIEVPDTVQSPEQTNSSSSTVISNSPSPQTNQSTNSHEGRVELLLGVLEEGVRGVNG
ncbi:hypothetical protein F5Y12DRAFT_736805 [Xylaria sp. FL1777]|nr:hypothetical protein F5Y12DRAFT_736805 [Xylaria sp. FL1777]